MTGSDSVNHPSHYTSHPSGVEAFTVTEHFNFNIGNAIKYLWRAGLKGEQLEDLRKAEWYVRREIERLERATSLEKAGRELADVEPVREPTSIWRWLLDPRRGARS